MEIKRLKQIRSSNKSFQIYEEGETETAENICVMKLPQ